MLSITLDGQIVNCLWPKSFATLQKYIISILSFKCLCKIAKHIIKTKNTGNYGFDNNVQNIDISVPSVGFYNWCFAVSKTCSHINELASQYLEFKEQRKRVASL